MAFGAIAIAGAGALISAYGTYKGAKASEAQARFNAEMARRNAFLAKLSARSVRVQGAEDAAALEQDVKGFIADQLVGIAGSGRAVETAGEIISDTARTGAADIRQIRRNAKRQAWGIKVGALGLEQQASALEAQARKISTLAPVITAGNIFTSAANIHFGLKRTQNPVQTAGA